MKRQLQLNLASFKTTSIFKAFFLSITSIHGTSEAI